ncbi:hypothetical protein C8K18_109261 [Paraburkholderia sp. GV068]|nr:hypothetical protein C8K19_109260 [Paraburkholderia sp. GV072]PUB02937.1 hypothetical protein C8K18_109261 [Paraburkholderia sp. GV068]
MNVRKSRMELAWSNDRAADLGWQYEIEMHKALPEEMRRASAGSRQWVQMSGLAQLGVQPVPRLQSKKGRRWLQRHAGLFEVRSTVQTVRPVFIFAATSTEIRQPIAR